MSAETHTPTSSLSFDNAEAAFRHKTDGQLRLSALIFRTMARPRLVGVLTKLTLIAFKLHLPISFLIRKTIYQQFVGGRHIADCEPVIAALGTAGIGSILDYSVEGKQHETDFDATAAELIRAAEYARDHDNIPFTCMKITGIARFELLELISGDATPSLAEQAEWERAEKRLNSVCKACANAGVPIYIDAEESWIQPAIDQLAETMMMRYNTSKAMVFTTVQLYRWDRLDYLKGLYRQCREKNVVVGVKLVRGAYLEKETARAALKGYRSPIQASKSDTDNDFNAALRFCIESLDGLEVVAGTHNENSCKVLAQLLQEHGLPHNHPSVFFSQLYGMSDHLSYVLGDNGYNVTKYLPYGPVAAVMPYLIRRAAENTSIAGQMGKELKLITNEQNRRKAQRS